MKKGYLHAFHLPVVSDIIQWAVVVPRSTATNAVSKLPRADKTE
jgi:hypothetical protein